MAYTGILIGLIFGYAAQRGRFCVKSAFQDIQLFRDFQMFHSLLVALVVQLAGFGLLAALDLVAPEAKPLYWKANISGGLVFGCGMVLAGGCAGSITYRVGEGSGLAFSAAAGFFLAGALTACGWLSPIAAYLQTSSLISTPDGTAPTLASIMRLPYPTMALGIAGLILVFWSDRLIQERRKASGDKVNHQVPVVKKNGGNTWSGSLTGTIIGISGIGAFLLSPASGRNYPLGITHGYVNFYRFVIGELEEPAWDTMLVAGTMLGACLAALSAREFRLRLPKAKLALRSVTGGFFMGFGAVTAGGCTIGHIVSGIPLLAISSLLTTASIISGTWLTTLLLFNLPHHLRKLGYNAAS